MDRKGGPLATEFAAALWPPLVSRRGRIQQLPESRWARLGRSALQTLTLNCCSQRTSCAPRRLQPQNSKRPHGTFWIEHSLQVARATETSENHGYSEIHTAVLVLVPVQYVYDDYWTFDCQFTLVECNPVQL